MRKRPRFVALLVSASLLAIVAGLAFGSYSVPRVSSTHSNGFTSLIPAPSGQAFLSSTGTPASSRPGTETSVCSLGIPWQLATGETGWASAGHCFAEPVSVVTTISGTVLGQGSAAVGENNERDRADAGFISATSPSFVTDTVQGLPQTEKITGSAPVSAGDKVCIAGAVSGISCGWEVTKTSAQIPISGLSGEVTTSGVVAYGRADECVQPGDSSSPVLKRTQGTWKWAGVVSSSSNRAGFPPVVAKVCSLSFTSVSQLIDTLGGTALPRNTQH